MDSRVGDPDLVKAFRRCSVARDFCLEGIQKMIGKISINLAKDKRFDEDRESLGELLDKCVEITGIRAVKQCDRERRREALWIARWAIRAVAEEMIRTGSIPLPLKVRFTGRDEIPSWRLGYDGDYSLN